jgi:hypothetical protein
MTITARTPAHTITAAGIVGVLANCADAIAAPVRQPTAIDRAIADMEASAAASYDAGIERGARLMVAEPHRIPRAVYGISAAMEWPTAKPTIAVLADCREFIRSETERGRDGHYSFDMHRLTALRQAETALVMMLGGA